MITVPAWWAIVVVVLILLGPGVIAAVVAIQLAERRMDRHLDGELRRPVVNPQEEADRAERAGGS